MAQKAEEALMLFFINKPDNDDDDDDDDDDEAKVLHGASLDYYRRSKIQDGDKIGFWLKKALIVSDGI